MFLSFWLSWAAAILPKPVSPSTGILSNSFLKSFISAIKHLSPLRVLADGCAVLAAAGPAEEV
ncbi:MAG: hypothetical protein A2X35_05770 [Elusimicrobia bacterium GWA2_61_42]|nr:MAG: hypothetical protein A2X35_05770 [Elusimicrobia bacterium GWA2_61_42]